MKQTKFTETALDETPNDNLSVPHGLIRTVRHYLEFVGVLGYIRGLKTKGIRLDLITVALCVYTLHTSNSMNACAKWLENPAVRGQLGFSKRDAVSQRTLNRGLEILGRNREGIITALWKGIQERFEIDGYDINMDGSAVVLYGPKSDYGAVGYGRDKNRGKMQVEFMVAQLAALGIPIYIKPYTGNTSDEAQYRDAVPELAGLVSRGDLHALDPLKGDVDIGEGLDDEDILGTVAAVALLGAAIVADNGAASERNTKRMESCGFSYLTRVELNKSDLRNIEEHCSEFEYLGDGMFCYAKTFKSSGRTTYLFLSRDLLEKGRHKARKRIQQDVDRYEAARSGGLRTSDYVTINRIPWVSVDVSIQFQETLFPVSETEIERYVRDRMGPKCGFFKLQSNRQMTPQEALRKYRGRAGVEHLISSLKRITGIKPIRVWNDDSVDGSMVLALLAEAAIGMARHCLPSVSDGEGEPPEGAPPPPEKAPKPSTESIVRSLNHLTLTRFRDGHGPFRTVLSNWDPISESIMATIRSHESPDWGSKKVPGRSGTASRTARRPTVKWCPSAEPAASDGRARMLSRV